MTLLNKCIQAGDIDRTVLYTFEQDYTVRDIIASTQDYVNLIGSEVDLHGQRVVLLIPHVLPFVSAAFAVNQLGGTVVPLSMQYRQEDLTSVLETISPQMIFTVKEHNGIAFSEIVNAWQKKSAMECTVFTFSEGTEWQRQDYPGELGELSDPEPCFIFFTSGSTGTPKGLVNREDTFNFYKLFNESMHMKSTDRMFSVPPINGGFGYNWFLAALSGGYELAIPDSFDFPKMVKLMKRLNCNKILATPSLMKAFYTMTQRLEPEAFRNLQVCYLAGEMVSEGFVDQFKLMTDTNFIGIYGMSEVGPAMYADLRGRIEWNVQERFQVRLIGEESTKELLVKSPVVIDYYYKQPELTKAFIDEEGYATTGDLVEMTTNGKIVLVGRKKDLIKKGGAQVVPGEVEKVLGNHPDVKQAAVLGVPHSVFGEQVVAYVVAERQIEAADLYTYCAEQIARYKVPDHIRFVDSLPLTAGKVDKVTLRKKFMSEKEQFSGGSV